MKKLFLLPVLIAFVLAGCEDDFEPMEQEHTCISDSTDLGTYYSDTATFYDTTTVVVYDTNSNVDWGSLPNFQYTFESNSMYDYNVDSIVKGTYKVVLSKELIIITIDGTVYESMADIEYYSASAGIVKGIAWNDAETISGTFLYQLGEFLEFNINHEGTIFNALLFAN